MLKWFILKTTEILQKFGSKSHEGIFLGYSTTTKAYIVYSNYSWSERIMHLFLYKSNVSLENSKDFLDDTLKGKSPQGKTMLETAPNPKRRIHVTWKKWGLTKIVLWIKSLLIFKSVLIWWKWRFNEHDGRTHLFLGLQLKQQIDVRSFLNQITQTASYINSEWTPLSLVPL